MLVDSDETDEGAGDVERVCAEISSVLSSRGKPVVQRRLKEASKLQVSSKAARCTHFRRDAGQDMLTRCGGERREITAKSKERICALHGRPQDLRSGWYRGTLPRT